MIGFSKKKIILFCFLLGLFLSVGLTANALSSCLDYKNTSWCGDSYCDPGTYCTGNYIMCSDGYGCVCDVECISGDCSGGVCVSAPSAPSCWTCSDSLYDSWCDDNYCDSGCGETVNPSSDCYCGGDCVPSCWTCSKSLYYSYCDDNYCDDSCGEDTSSGSCYCGNDCRQCGDSCSDDNDCVSACPYCSGGVCKATLCKNNGEACTAGSQCCSGYCVDGVCCNNSCTGTCRTCYLSATYKGTCYYHYSETDPDNECYGTGTCGGTCNGSGACQFPSTSVTCSSLLDCDYLNYYYQSPSGDSPTATDNCYYRDYADTYRYCNGAGSCSALNCSSYSNNYQYGCGTCCYIPSNYCTGGTKGSCAYYSASTQGPTADYYYQTGTESAAATEYCYWRDYHCTGNSCGETYSNTLKYSCGLCKYISSSNCTGGTLGSCSTYADGSSCGTNQFCAGGVCKKGNGQTCSTGGECYSGYCVDGYCCNNSCTGTCTHCNATPGTCTYIAAGQDPDSECFGTGTCGGTCNGSGACQFPSTSVTCSSLQDCDYLNYYYQSPSGDSPVGTDKCYYRDYADTYRYCNGAGSCSALNCSSYSNNYQYECGYCKYIPSTSCTGSTQGSCSNYAKGTSCGTDKECDGSGNCVSCAFPTGTISASKTNVETGEQFTITVTGNDDNDVWYLYVKEGAAGSWDSQLCLGTQTSCTKTWNFTKSTPGTYQYYGWVIDSDDVHGCSSYHESATTPTYVEVTVIKANGETCSTGSECASGYCVDGYCCNNSCTGLCRHCNATPGTCTYIAAGNDPDNECYGTGTCGGTCNGSGACQYPTAGTKCGTCQTCNGSGSCNQTPADDSACGTIDCDGLDSYYQSGTESPTATEDCYYRNYSDITTNRCEGFGDCKDPNSSDCTDYSDTLKYSCGLCKYISASNCTGGTLGSCSTYADGTSCGTDKTCETGDCRDNTQIEVTAWGTNSIFDKSSVVTGEQVAVGGYLKTADGTPISGYYFSLWMWNGTAYDPVTEDGMDSIGPTNTSGYAGKYWTPSSSYEGTKNYILFFPGGSYYQNQTADYGLTVIVACPGPANFIYGPIDDIWYSGQFKISWDSVTGASTYRLEWCEEGYNFGDSGCCLAYPNCYRVTSNTETDVYNLTPCKRYSWRVRVESGTGCGTPGEWSNLVMPYAICPGCALGYLPGYECGFIESQSAASCILGYNNSMVGGSAFKANCYDVNTTLCMADKCPSLSNSPSPEYSSELQTYSDGAVCNANVPSFTLDFMRSRTGVWDASEYKCIRCSGKFENKICGDETKLYASVDLDVCILAGNGKCEAACGAATECDEKNPGDSCAFGVCDTSCNCIGPDLIITDIWDSSGTIKYTIMNQGNGDAGESYAALYIDGTYTEYDYVASLSAGSSSYGESFSYDWRANCTGESDLIQVCADYFGPRIDESDETNNCAPPETWVCDATPPTTTISPNGTDWVNYDVNFTLTCTDGGSGCQTTQYKIIDESQTCDTSGLTTGTSGIVTCPVNQACRKKVCFRSVDNAGNPEDIKTSNLFKIDKAAPTTEVGP